MAANPPAVPGRHKPVVLLCCPVFRFCQRFSLELPVERVTQAKRTGSGREGPGRGTVILALIWPRCLQAALFGFLCGTWKPFYYSQRILWLQLVRDLDVPAEILKYCRHFKVFFALRISTKCSELCRIFHSMPLPSVRVGPLIYAVTEAKRERES